MVWARADYGHPQHRRRVYILCCLGCTAADVMFGGKPVVCDGGGGCAADLPAGSLCRRCHYDWLGAGVEGGSEAEDGQEAPWNLCSVLFINVACRLCVTAHSSQCSKPCSLRNARRSRASCSLSVPDLS